jgi:hypothetical protein
MASNGDRKPPKFHDTKLSHRIGLILKYFSVGSENRTKMMMT